MGKKFLILKKFLFYLSLLFIFVAVASCSTISSVDSNNAVTFSDGLITDDQYFGDYYSLKTNRMQYCLEKNDNYYEFIKKTITSYLENKLVLSNPIVESLYSNRVLTLKKDYLEVFENSISIEYQYNSVYSFYSKTCTAYVTDENGRREACEINQDETFINAWYFVSYDINDGLHAIFLQLLLPGLNQANTLEVSIIDYFLSKKPSTASLFGHFLISKTESRKDGFDTHFEDYLCYFDEKELIDLSTAEELQLVNDNITFIFENKVAYSFLFDDSKGCFVSESECYILECLAHKNGMKIDSVILKINLNVCSKLYYYDAVFSQSAFLILATLF